MVSAGGVGLGVGPGVGLGVGLGVLPRLNVAAMVLRASASAPSLRRDFVSPSGASLGLCCVMVSCGCCDVRSFAVAHNLMLIHAGLLWRHNACIARCTMHDDRIVWQERCGAWCSSVRQRLLQIVYRQDGARVVRQAVHESNDYDDHVGVSGLLTTLDFFIDVHRLPLNSPCVTTHNNVDVLPQPRRTTLRHMPNMKRRRVLDDSAGHAQVDEAAQELNDLLDDDSTTPITRTTRRTRSTRRLRRSSPRDGLRARMRNHQQRLLRDDVPLEASSEDNDSSHGASSEAPPTRRRRHSVVLDDDEPTSLQLPSSSSASIERSMDDFIVQEVAHSVTLCKT